MAKIESGVGPLKGRVGNMRFYVVNGQNIMTSIPREVRNPKSEAQMKQRIKINNIIDMYKGIKGFVKNNFEGIYGNNNVSNLFRSHNLMLAPVWLTENHKLSDKFILAPYVVSFGRFPTIEYEYRNKMFVTDLNIGTLEITSTTTIDEITSAVIRNNEHWTTGDNLKILLLLQNTPADISANISNPICIETLQFCNIDGHLAICADQEGTFAFAVCHTRGEGMKVLASPQKLLLSDSAVYDYFAGEEAMTAALKSYKTKGYKDK